MKGACFQVKKKHDHTTQEEIGESDLTEGVPDVEGLKDLLLEDTNITKSDKGHETRHSETLKHVEEKECGDSREHKGDENKEISDIRKEDCAENYKENETEQRGSFDTCSGDKNEDELEQNKSEKSEKSFRTNLESEENVQSEGAPSKTEENTESCEESTEGREKTTGCGEESGAKFEHAVQGHLYPDLSEQLQQFMVENELVRIKANTGMRV